MEGAPAGPISWSHGFVCRLLDLDPGAAIGTHSRAEPEVLFVHEGDLTAEYDGALIRLGAGDVASIPAGEARGYRSEGGASVFVTRGGDTPSPPSWAEAVSGGGMLSPGRVDPAVASPAERPIEDLLSVRPRRQALDGFEPVYSDLVDYIIRCTHRIWEEKNVGLCRTHYSEDCPIHTLAGDVNGVEAVVRNTLATLAAFPDRTLIGEDVVWSEDRPGLFHSSHRIVSLMTHLGDDGFGPATGRRAQVTTIADCLVRENRIVEEWLVRDNAHLVAQLGIDPWTLARSQAESDAGAPAGTHEWRTAELTRVRAGDALAAPPPSDHPAAGPAQALELAVNEAQLGQAAEVLSVAVEGVWPSGRRWFGRGGWIGAWNQLTGVLASPRLVVDHWAATPLPRDEMAVALRWSLAGAHVQPGVYGPPTGRDLLVLGVSHYRLRGGRVIEDVTVFDELAMLRQLAGGLGA
jgi:predicted ester cyclase